MLRALTLGLQIRMSKKSSADKAADEERSSLLAVLNATYD